MSDPDPHPNVAVAMRLVDSVSRGDIGAVDDLYADDIRVWRNIDQRELVKKQALKVVAILAQLKDLEYRDLRIEATEHGYVQQHTLSCTGPAGDAVRIPSCIVARVEGDRIARIDEYADSAAMAPLMG